MPLPPRRPGWAVQIGAFRRESQAIAGLASLKPQEIAQFGNAGSVIQPSRSSSGKPLYRVMFVGYERAEAEATCARLKRAGRDCLAVSER